MRYQLTLVRMAIINKSTNNAGEGMEKRKHSYFWWECKLVQPLWKTVWRFLRKLNIEIPKKKEKEKEIPYDPAIPLMDIYLDKTTIQKDTHTDMFIATLFTTAKIWKQPKNVHQQMNKLWKIYKYTHIYTHTHWNTTQP